MQTIKLKILPHHKKLILKSLKKQESKKFNRNLSSKLEKKTLISKSIKEVFLIKINN